MPVRLDPYQTIVNVGWGGPYALIISALNAATEETNLDRFNVVFLKTPAGFDGTIFVNNTTEGETMRPVYPVGEVDPRKIWLKWLGDFGTEIAGGPFGGVFFINISRIVSELNAAGLLVGQVPRFGLVHTTVGEDAPEPLGKLRYAVYAGRQAAFAVDSYNPSALISGGESIDDALALLTPAEGLQAKLVANVVQPLVGDFDVALIEGTGGNRYDWFWDFVNRNNAAAIPPAGANPTFVNA